MVVMVTQMEGGGAQRAAQRLAEGLRDRGVDARLWFFYRKRPSHDDLPFASVLIGSPPDGLAWLVRLLGELVGRLRRFSPDCVLTLTHNANVVGQACAVIARVPHRVASQRNPCTAFPPGARVADAILGTVGTYHRNVMVSRSVLASFAGYPAAYRRRASVIENGVEPGPTATLAEGSPITVVTVARLSAQKNHALLLQAAEASRGTWRMSFIGAGELEAELRSLASELGVEDRVEFVGELDQGGVRERLRAASAFALPSRFEGMSNATLEAMAAGLPILASDIPAQRQLLAVGWEEPAGMLLSPDDAGAWAEALDALDAEARRRWGRRARVRARLYSPERMVDRFARVMRLTDSRSVDVRESGSRLRDPKWWRAFCPASVRLNAVGLREYRALLVSSVERGGERLSIASGNLHGAYLYHRDEDLRWFLDRSVVRVDGMPLVLLGRLAGAPVPAACRLTWIDFLPWLVELCVARSWSITYVGSSDEVARRAEAALRERYPGLRFRARSGYFDLGGAADDEVVEWCAEEPGSLLLVGMGMGRQERWIRSRWDRLQHPVVMTCGALMEYVAGVAYSPPRWAGRSGLEWLFRLGSNPRRLWRRYLVEPLLLIEAIASGVARRAPRRRPSPSSFHFAHRDEPRT